MVFIQASKYRVGRREEVNLIVLHCTVSPEGSTAAEDVANYFAGDKAGGSAHWVHDPDSTVQCVRLADTAFHAPPVNDRSIGHEMCGEPTQTRAQWLDSNSLAIIKRTATAVRADCLRFGIPLRRLSNAQLAAGETGIVDHKQVSDTFGVSTHWDPGPGFPWDVFMQFVLEDDDVVTDADINKIIDRLMATPVNATKTVKDALSEGSLADNAVTVAQRAVDKLESLLLTPVKADGTTVLQALSESSADYDVDRADAAVGASLAADVAKLNANMSLVLTKLGVQAE